MKICKAQVHITEHNCILCAKIKYIQQLSELEQLIIPQFIQ